MGLLHKLQGTIEPYRRDGDKIGELPKWGYADLIERFRKAGFNWDPESYTAKRIDPNSTHRPPPELLPWLDPSCKI